MNLFINGYVKARGIEAIAKIIVKKLKLINTKKANKHKKIAYTEESFIEIFPEATGLVLVLSTFLSIFLSAISLTIHPADLIRTEPKKNNRI